VSVRRETLQIARLAPKLLGDSTDLVAEFVRGRLRADGGFTNRGGDSDLYYTVFGLQALLALRVDLPVESCVAYLRGFGAGEDLDLVHLSCLAGCWAMMPASALAPTTRDAIIARVESYRTDDGGYHASRDAGHGTAYHAFLALGAYQDLGAMPPYPDRVAASLAGLASADGAFANDPGRPRGSTPATAAAVTLIRHLDMPASPALAGWLLARCREGGFFASPDAPVPDLLSTATALHALSSLHAPIDGIREACLDFVDSLWTSQGAFYGTWADDVPDCEYTFYGLLALGHLAV
jgi:geranylgeranyl transferase type-2 subunit beta